MRAYGKSGLADSATTPSWTDRNGELYPCCAERRSPCAQHVAQRQVDLQWKGYAITARRIAAGMFAHLGAN